MRLQLFRIYFKQKNNYFKCTKLSPTSDRIKARKMEKGTGKVYRRKGKSYFCLEYV